MLARESSVSWRTLRPYIMHEIEPGLAPEIPPKPWLAPAQMQLAKKVLANETRRHSQTGSRLELKGKRFGRLIALRMVGADRGRNIIWLCRCDCGRTKPVAASNLRTGDTRSCGCLKRESARRVADLIRPKAMAAIRAKGARTRGVA
jgi:hypothetical protein